MNQFRAKMAQFFYGRNGSDAIVKFTLGLSIVFALLTMITNHFVVYLLFIATLVYGYWRMMSKNIPKRYQENQKFLIKTAGIRRFFSDIWFKVRRWASKTKYDAGQRQQYKIFNCPNCNQKLRAPKGRGQIMVTCNKCKTQFKKRV